MHHSYFSHFYKTVKNIPGDQIKLNAIANFFIIEDTE